MGMLDKWCPEPEKSVWNRFWQPFFRLVRRTEHMEVRGTCTGLGSSPERCITDKMMLVALRWACWINGARSRKNLSGTDFGSRFSGWSAGPSTWKCEAPAPDSAQVPRGVLQIR